uniref:Uncharacterized protein n=1 Tax=Caenorhabditis tropicalis TaxID=1561998 RepID=A0A1I7TA27_9PELO
MYKRRILQMDGNELRAVVAIVLPGRKGDELKLGEMQEICIKWLFANGLSINHIFEILDDGVGGLFCLMRNSEACLCCPKSDESGNLTEFDHGPIGNNFKRTPSPIRKSSEKSDQVKFELPSPDTSSPPTPPSKPPLPSNKVAPITVQPTIISVSDKKEEEKRKRRNQIVLIAEENVDCVLSLSEDDRNEKKDRNEYLKEVSGKRN